MFVSQAPCHVIEVCFSPKKGEPLFTVRKGNGKNLQFRKKMFSIKFPSYF